MATYQATLNALGDPTRRALFERLRAGPAPVGELARQFPVSRSAVSQHLRILSEAGLVHHRAVGTRRVYAVDRAGLAPLREFLDRAWDEGLAQFQSIADAEQEGVQKLIEPEVDLTIRKSVSVRLPADRAFALFTDRISTWWPYQMKSVGLDRTVGVVLEGWVGGRLYEQIDGGGQALWGHVKVWDPPKRLLMSWEVNPDNPATIIEVTFTPTESGTLVQLEHRGWERYGESAATYAADYRTGWDQIFVTGFGAKAGG